MAPVFSARLPVLWILLHIMVGSLQHSHALKAQSSNKTMGDSSFGARRKVINWSLTAKACVLTSRRVSPFQPTQHLKPKMQRRRDKSVNNKPAKASAKTKLSVRTCMMSLPSLHQLAGGGAGYCGPGAQDVHIPGGGPHTA